MNFESELSAKMDAKSLKCPEKLKSNIQHKTVEQLLNDLCGQIVFSNTNTRSV